MFIARLLFMVLLTLLVTPGILVFNLTPRISYIWKLSHPFLRVCVSLYIVKGACTLLFYHVGTSTEANSYDCTICHLFRFNPGACLCIEVPQRLLTLGRTRRGWMPPPPHKVFLTFFLEDRTSVSDVSVDVRSSLAQILR